MAESVIFKARVLEFARSKLCKTLLVCSTYSILSFLYVCMVNTIYLLSFVETPRKFIIAELSIRKLGSSSVLVLLALMKIRAYGSKALQ